MKWVAIIISIVFALGFLFVAMAAVAALFASALVAVMFANVDYDEMEVGKTNKRTESISKTTNKRK